VTDFLDRLEHQLVERAREGVAREPARWSRRTLAFAVVAILAVLSVPAAAVTGVFSAPHHAPSGPGLVDLNPPCDQKDPPQGTTTSSPPPAAITQAFAIFRRSQVPADRLPPNRLGLFITDGVNPDFVRRATSSNGLHAYLIPAQNIDFRPVGGGKGPGCERLVHPDTKAKPGICLRLPSAAGSCGSVEGILTGKSLLTEGGSTHGRTLAAGIVPDGVKTVIWRVRRGSGFLDTRIPVRDNVYIGRFPGRMGHGLYVYFVDASGKHLVIGPSHLTAKQRAQRLRDAKLDQAAGPTPSVDPAVGGARTLFVLRMRVPKPTGGYVYAVTVRGRQPGACTKPYRYKIGMVPGMKGTDRGLMRALFGAGAGYVHWCAGTYRGTVRRQRGSSWKASGRVVGTFQFRVR
jgi:hypothetical protein